MFLWSVYICEVCYLPTWLRWLLCLVKLMVLAWALSPLGGKAGRLVGTIQMVLVEVLEWLLSSIGVAGAWRTLGALPLGRAVLGPFLALNRMSLGQSFSRDLW